MSELAATTKDSLFPRVTTMVLSVSGNRVGAQALFIKEKNVKNVKINVALDERNRARLETKSYERAYVDVPNRSLPAALKDELNVIHEALTGNPLSEDGSTFTVRADAAGTFKRLYSPTVFSTEEKGLIIRWGSDDIPLAVNAGKIGAPTADKKAKFSFKEEQIGKYGETVLSVSIARDGALFTMPFPVKAADWEAGVSPDVLDVLLDENPDAISEQIAVAGDLTKRGESSGPRLQGHIIKVSELPIGSYAVTGYRSRETTFGTDYMIQTVVEEPFVAMSRVKDETTEEWVDAEVEVSGFAIVKPNSAMKKLFAAEPIIDESNPATMVVLDHGEWNGYKTAKVSLKCTAFKQDDGSFDINF